MKIKPHRLRKNRHFQYIYRKGLTVHSRFITLVYTKTKLQPFKVGFSVSKKIGKSVVRSKVKRLLKSSFVLIGDRFSPEYNYIFVAKAGIENLTFKEIQTEMLSLLSRLNKKI